MSLRRVPPNLLAGPGATDFAESLHMPVIAPDGLVSHAARERWLKWARDLKAAESRVLQSNEGSETGGAPQDYAEDSDENETLQYPAPSGQQSRLPSMSQTSTPRTTTTPLGMWSRIVDERTSNVFQVMIPQLLHQSSGWVWTLP